jgi:CheY-like chemotaxis protein
MCALAHDLPPGAGVAAPAPTRETPKMPVARAFNLIGASIVAGGGANLVAQQPPTASTSFLVGVGAIVTGLATAFLPYWIQNEREKRKERRTQQRLEKQERQNARLRREAELLRGQVEELQAKSPQVDENTVKIAGQDGKLRALFAQMEDAGIIRPPRVPAPPGTTPRLLVVEDDARAAGLLSRLFTEMGFDTMLAASADEALALIALRPAWVVLDLRLGAGDGGIEVLRRLRDAGSPSRVVVTTGESDESVLAEVRALGPAAILIKPIHYEELVDLLQPPARPHPRSEEAARAPA